MVMIFQSKIQIQSRHCYFMAFMNLFLISIGVKSMIGAFELPDSVL